MEITDDLLRKIYQRGGKYLAPCMPYFAPAMKFTKIDDPVDQCMFFTQLEHECDNFNTLREYADGSAYEGRLDLGNTEPGDGRRYPGRGGIQVTGRGAARACGRYFSQPFEERPEFMEMPRWAIHVSGWFWAIYKPWVQCAAKRGWLEVCTKFVNGGLNGWGDRLAKYQDNADVMGVPRWRKEVERDSILKFQRDSGLLADGLVGQKTITALMKSRG